VGLVQFLIGLVVARLLLLSIPTTRKPTLSLRLSNKNKLKQGVGLEKKERYMSKVAFVCGLVWVKLMKTEAIRIALSGYLFVKMFWLQCRRSSACASHGGGGGGGGFGSGGGCGDGH